MSFDGDNIQNVRSGLFTDLTGSNFAPGTSVIIFSLNQAPSGTANQQWRITPVPAGTNLFTIQNVLTGLYAGINGQAQAGMGIVSSVVSMPWQINHAGDAFSHSVTIQVPYTTLFWSVASNTPTTNITLAGEDGSTGQQWTTRTTLPPA